MPTDSIIINRAPVLTLWAAVVAEHVGFDKSEALSLAKAVAGQQAQAKGQTLGIYHHKLNPDGTPAHKKNLGEEFWVQLCGKNIPSVQTVDGIRAVSKDKPVEPESVQKYLVKAFGEALDEVRNVMELLASSRDPGKLNSEAFRLYEKFRPAVDSGVSGWGQKGKLDLEMIRKMATAQ